MTEHEHTNSDEPTLKLYMIIAAALAVFTASSFVANSMARSGTITPTMSFIIILGVAVCKAVLVGVYFMHLKYDWGKLYFMIISCVRLGSDDDDRLPPRHRDRLALRHPR